MKNSVFAIFGLVFMAASTLWAGGTLTFEERVAAQEAIGRENLDHSSNKTVSEYKDCWRIL